MNAMLAAFLVARCLLFATADVPCVKIRSPSTSWQNNTDRIQAAIDAASTSKGCVSVGGGDYLVQTIKVGSYTRFRIEPDARILMTPNITTGAVVLLDGVHDVVLEGGGTIHGNAELMWNNFSKTDDRMSPINPDGGSIRANVLLMKRSRNVVVRDIKLHNSSDWTFRMDNCSNIYVDNVDIYGDSRFPNNDGFDPNSCINVTLVNSRIDVADDGICPKASAGFGPLQGLYVHNVTIRSHSHAIKFGSNTDTRMSDIVFDNITIHDSNGGMR
jgi:polygalacturonase